MTNETKSERPTHRVSFSRIIATAQDGNDILGPAREIGAVWARRNGKKGGIIRLDHVPAELVQHQGVLFLTEVTEQGDA